MGGWWDGGGGFLDGWKGWMGLMEMEMMDVNEMTKMNGWRDRMLKGTMDKMATDGQLSMGWTFKGPL